MNGKTNAGAMPPEEMDAVSRFEGEGGSVAPAPVKNGPARDGATTTRRQTSAGIQGRFRRLKWNEIVTAGDFVMNDERGFEPWEGPSGFRADAFVKVIYRAGKSGSRSTQKAT